MSSKKKIVTIVITTAALSISTVGVATAAGVKAQRVAITKSAARISGPDKSVEGKSHAGDLAAMLNGLVIKGTITQLQADAINKALADKSAAHEANRAAHDATKDANRAAHDALISSTIGLDAATIKLRLKAGETLGAIAGDKKDALIAALVAFHTKNIDAAVTAGKISAAQATTAKASLIARITQAVNSTKPAGGPMGHMGGHMGHKDGAPLIPQPTT